MVKKRTLGSHQLQDALKSLESSLSQWENIPSEPAFSSSASQIESRPKPENSQVHERTLRLLAELKKQIDSLSEETSTPSAEPLT